MPRPLVSLPRASRLSFLDIAAATLACAAALSSSAAETLYATTLRGEAGTTEFVAGNLYSVDPSTAAAKVIGPIRVGNTAIGITAVATHPRTGVFYGITAGLSTSVSRSLVIVDLDSAKAQIVASLRMRGSDIGFAPDGTLYMWAPEQRQVVKVDVDTGAVTSLGPSGIDESAGGGLAIEPGGRRAYVAARGATGTLDLVDLETGKATPGPQLKGAPYPAAIDNMTVSPSGVLYAVNSNGGAPSTAELVTIDIRTGVVTPIGPLPRDTRGLIFAPERDRGFSWEEARKWILVVLGVAGAALIIVAARMR
jgi:hypothetical protein